MNAVNITHAVARGYEIGILDLGTAGPKGIMVAATLSQALTH
jgi:hypothetical protein